MIFIWLIPKNIDAFEHFFRSFSHLIGSNVCSRYFTCLKIYNNERELNLCVKTRKKLDRNFYKVGVAVIILVTNIYTQCINR